LKVAHTVQVYNSVQLYSLGAVQVYNMRTAVCPIGATSVCNLGPERYVKGVQQCGDSVERPRGL
jgi:hypothetical protein